MTLGANIFCFIVGLLALLIVVVYVNLGARVVNRVINKEWAFSWEHPTFDHVGCHMVFVLINMLVPLTVIGFHHLGCYILRSVL